MTNTWQIFDGNSVTKFNFKSNHCWRVYLDHQLTYETHDVRWKRKVVSFESLNIYKNKPDDLVMCIYESCLETLLLLTIHSTWVSTTVFVIGVSVLAILAVFAEEPRALLRTLHESGFMTPWDLMFLKAYGNTQNWPMGAERIGEEWWTGTQNLGTHENQKYWTWMKEKDLNSSLYGSGLSE